MGKNDNYTGNEYTFRADLLVIRRNKSHLVSSVSGKIDSPKQTNTLQFAYRYAQRLRTTDSRINAESI